MAGLALAVVPATSAFAHAALESSVPAGNAVLDQAPTEIRLAFDEPVTAEPGAIRLLDSRGQDRTVGPPERGPSASVVTASVPGLPDGGYVVAWRVISQDGHPADGAFTFQVGRGPVADTRSLLASVLDAQGGNDTVRQLADLGRVLTYVGLALAIGSALFVTSIWPGAGAQWRARRVVWIGWGVLLGSTVILFIVSAPYLTGRSLGSAFDLSLIRTVSDTRTFRVVVARLVLVLLGLPLMLALKRGLSRNAQLVGVLIAELTIGTVALFGHGGSGRLAGLGVVLDAVHLGAMSVWLGGLAVLSVLLLGDRPGGRPPSRSSPSDVAAPAHATGVSTPVAGSVGAALAPLDERRAAVDRFSTVGFACVVTLVVTGVAQAWRILPGGIGDLTTTDYGRTLLVKLLFVVCLVAAGWWSRRLVRRRSYGQPLWRSVSTELVIALAVLTVTATLTGTSPVDASSSSGTVSATMVQGDLLADVSVSPGKVGANDLHLYLSPPGGSLQPVKDVTARMVLPTRPELGEIPISLTPAGPNHFLASGVQIPYAGIWRFEVVATTSSGTTVLLKTNLKIPA